METLKIKIKIKENNVELTLDEAQALHMELGKLFETGKTQPWAIPQTVPPIPVYPWPNPNAHWTSDRPN